MSFLLKTLREWPWRIWMALLTLALLFVIFYRLAGPVVGGYVATALGAVLALLPLLPAFNRHFRTAAYAALAIASSITLLYYVCTRRPGPADTSGPRQLRIGPSANDKAPASAPYESRAQRPTHDVVFMSSPTGAAVHIDGLFMGTTGLTVTLSAGRHTVNVSKDGFRSYDDLITVPRQTILSVILEHQ